MANLDVYGSRWPVSMSTNHFINLIPAIRIYPVHDKAVGCQQTQAIGFFNRLQGPDPGIDLLLAEPGLKRLNTAIPKGYLHVVPVRN